MNIRPTSKPFWLDSAQCAHSRKQIPHKINKNSWLWHVVNSSHKLIRNWQWIYGLCESMRQCKYNANFHFPKNWYLHWIVMNLRNKNWYFTHEFVLPIGLGHITWELKRIISWIFTLESQKNIFCFQKAHKRSWRVVEYPV